jgi:hypothetical protein
MPRSIEEITRRALAGLDPDPDDDTEQHAGSFTTGSTIGLNSPGIEGSLNAALGINPNNL